MDMVTADIWSNQSRVTWAEDLCRSGVIAVRWLITCRASSLQLFSIIDREISLEMIFATPPIAMQQRSIIKKDN
jgi:hypothetical protein